MAARSYDAPQPYRADPCAEDAYRSLMNVYHRLGPSSESGSRNAAFYHAARHHRGPRYESKAVSGFDSFMRHYLTVKTGEIPNVREVYEAFKRYAHSPKVTGVEGLVADIRAFAAYYCAMALGAEPDRRTWSLRAVGWSP